jgi:hypothetical protein
VDQKMELCRIPVQRTAYELPRIFGFWQWDTWILVRRPHS